VQRRREEEFVIVRESHLILPWTKRPLLHQSYHLSQMRPSEVLLTSDAHTHTSLTHG
jgi:hypothetical protein